MGDTKQMRSSDTAEAGRQKQTQTGNVVKCVGSVALPCKINPAMETRLIRRKSFSDERLKKLRVHKSYYEASFRSVARYFLRREGVRRSVVGGE